MAEYGIISIIPTLVVLLLAIKTRRTVESLVAGVIVGLLILDFRQTIPNLASTTLSVLADDTVRWIILVCGLLGSLIALLSASGASIAFGNLFVRFVDSKRKSMVATMLMGIFIFIDDYLNALAVSSSMRHVTEKHRVSPQMLAYIVDSTAAPISLLIPISTWAIFFSALIETNGLAPAGEGFSLYISSIPFMFYAWIAMLLVFLVAIGVVPLIGPMKAAEKNAEAHGVTSITADVDQVVLPEKPAGLWTFLVPMVVLVAVTVWYDVDIFIGVITAMLVIIAMLAYQKTLPLDAIFDKAFDGFVTMMQPLAVVVGGFMLKEINDKLGLTQFAIDNVAPLMTANTFPLICFIILGLLAFATSSIWGIFVVSFPIVVPIATTLGIDPRLIIGAMLSASVFGSHACFYSDSTVLSAKGSGCTPLEHAFTQIPYALIGAALSSVLFFTISFFF